MTDKVTGAPQVRYQTLQQVTTTDLDRAQRLISKYLQDTLRALLSDEDGAAVTGVLHGLAVTVASSGDLAVDVSTGLAFVDDASGLADATLDSRYRAALLRAALVDVALDAADGSNPRRDAIVISWDYDTWSQESRNIRLVAGGTPQATNIDVFEGPAPVVAVVTGTPAGSPSAPAIPAGSIRLANILVAAGATTAAGLTASDTRPMTPRPAKPGTLAGGTAVDGGLAVSGALSGGTITSLGLLLGVNALFTETMAARDYAATSLSDTAAALKTRSTATGTPDASDDSVVVEVERGDSANAGLRWDEGEGAWQASRATGLGYQALAVGGYNPGAGAVNNRQVAIWQEQITFSFLGGAPEETFNGSLTANLFASGSGEARGVAVISGTSGASAAKAMVRVALVDDESYTVTVRTHDGTDFTTGHEIFVTFLIFGRAAG